MLPVKMVKLGALNKYFNRQKHLNQELKFLYVGTFDIFHVT